MTKTNVGIILVVVVGCAVAASPNLSVLLLLLFFIVISWIKPVLFFQGLLVLSLALPTSNVSTQVFSTFLFGYHILWTDVLLVMVLVRWLATRRYRGRQQHDGLLSRKLRYLVFGLIGWTILEVAIGFWRNYDSHLILYDARPVLYFLAILISMEYLSNERTLVLTIKGFIIGLVLYSLLTLSYFLAGSAHPLASLFETQSWVVVNRLTYQNESFMLVALPLMVLLILHLHGAFAKKLLLIAGLSLLVTQLFISLSRGNFVLALASIGISLVFYEMFWRRSGLLKASFSTVLPFVGVILVVIMVSYMVLLPTLLGPNSPESIRYFGKRFDITTEGAYLGHIEPRLNMYRAGLQAVLDSPIIGHGYGFMFDIEGWEGQVSFVDSTWITLWIRSGLVGVALLFGIVVIYTRSILRVMHRLYIVRDVYVRVFYCAMAGGGITLLLHSLLNSWWINSTAVLPLLIIVGASLQYGENLIRYDRNQKK